jgi:flavin prenyltransferase
MNQKPIIVAITGASGSVYGLRLVYVLAELGHQIALTVSEGARVVMREEHGLMLRTIENDEFLRGLYPEHVINRITYYAPGNLAAPIASGSYPTRGMFVMPASTNTFSKMANGISDTLVERAAECVMKEGRQLIVVPRETPLSAIHLENLLKLARLGVRIVPAVPGFYAGAHQVDELVDFVVGKTLDQLQIEHTLYRRWTGSQAGGEEHVTAPSETGGGVRWTRRLP